MTKLTLMLCFILSVLSMNAQESLEGVWDTGEDNSKVEISSVNGMFSGNLLSSDNSKAEIGRQIIRNVKRKDGKWQGQLYAVKKGKWYDAVLKSDGNKLFIEVTVGFMKKKIEWKKD